MLILPNSVFLHVPKTAGSWVTKAIITSGIECEDYRINGDPHKGIADCPSPDKFKFLFVRHPVSFYRSYWQFKMTSGWDLNNAVDNACKSENFQAFVANVIQHFPKLMTRILIDFIDRDLNNIDFYGRYENLTEDLISALKQANEEFDEDAIRNMPPFNVSNKTKFPAQYTEELEQEVRSLEDFVIQNFGYD